MDMGELLPKGQLAVEPAADQRPVALVRPNQRAITRKLPKKTIGDPAEACQG